MPGSAKPVGFLSLSSIFCLVLLPASCAAQPPRETGDFKRSDLVELTKLDPTIQLDIRYATSHNLAGRPVYAEARAFLQRPAAEALVRANQKLKPLGYRLLVFDGYRPWRVTKLFWDVTSQANKKFVANPRKGSRHNRGCAVDLSLCDLATGREVAMPGEYDEMSERSASAYAGGPAEQRRRRDLLRRQLERQGFTVNKAEWWHFDFAGWKSYRIQDVPFSEIK